MDRSGTLVLRGTEVLGTLTVLDLTGREVARKDNVRRCFWTDTIRSILEGSV